MSLTVYRTREPQWRTQWNPSQLCPKLFRVPGSASQNPLDCLSVDWHCSKPCIFIGLSKERPYLVLALNLILSQISSFTHIYGFADFNGFVDLRILADLITDLRISKDHLAHKGQLFYLIGNLKPWNLMLCEYVFRSIPLRRLHL